MKSTIITIALLLTVFTAKADVTEKVVSPDGKLEFVFTQTNKMSYFVTYGGKSVIAPSRLGVAIENKLLESALAVPNEDKWFRGEGWCDNLQYVGRESQQVNTTWTPTYGEWQQIPDNYNEALLRFKKGEEEVSADGYVKSKCYFFNIRVRAYNEGVAFRYEFPETSNGLFIHMTDELTEFRVDAKAKAYSSEWAQGPFLSPDLSQPFDGELERPMTIQYPDGLAVSLVEAACVDYVRTKFILKGDGVVKAQPHGAVDFMTPYSTSWRTVMVADNMIDLCNHDYLVLNLNERADRDFSWINPGKAFRSDLNKDALYKAVDFAAEHNMQYVHLDAGWYGPEGKMTSSALATAANRDFTIPEIVDYAKQKGIGVIVYVNQRALYQQIDSICALYEQWGVKGIKYGFVQVGNQKWTSWLHEIVRKCADHHLMVDIHDEYRPTGYSRTYPNLMSAEGIRGNEEMPDATHNVTLPFTRYLCGPADYTLCYFNNRVKCTHAHQLAMAAVYYSPLTWMYWYDKPHFVNNEPELEFWNRIPTVWDDTRVLQGNPGEFIVTARRSSSDWFIGAMNGGTPVNEKGADRSVKRTVTLSLDFLDKDRMYIAHLYEDDTTIKSDVNTKKMRAAKRTQVRCTTRNVNSNTVLTLPLLNSGGAAIWIEEAK